MLVLWIVNDHILKDLYGNFWTGKLSDVAGLVVFPLIPLAMYEFVCVWRNTTPKRQNAVLTTSMVFTAFLLISINLSDMASDMCCRTLAILQWPFIASFSLLSGSKTPPISVLSATPDPTDLFTLPALFIPLFIHKITSRKG